MNKKQHIPYATLFNVLTVVIGSTIGFFAGHLLSEGIKEIAFQAIGLATILIGLKMTLQAKSNFILLVVFSLIIGGIIGELIHLDLFLQTLSERTKSYFDIEQDKFTEGLITAFLLFCVGSMTIVGALEEGLKGKRDLIMTKSILDGFASMALASGYGLGVIFSVVPLLIFQGGISLIAVYVKPIFDDDTLEMISSVGGLLIIGIAINILQLGQINLENLLPSLGVCIIMVKGYQKYHSIMNVNSD